MKKIIPLILISLSTFSIFAYAPSNSPYWVNAGYGRIPKHAVIGGRDASGSPLYICQAQFQGDTYTGKIVGDNCNFSYGNAEAMTPHYQVLVAHDNYAWISVSNSFIPINPLFHLCQAEYQHGLHPGKIINHRCHVNFAGNEVKADRYNVFIGKKT